MIKIKRNIKELIYKNRAFFNRDMVDRPLIGVGIIGREYMRFYKEISKNMNEGKQLNPDDIIIEDFIKDVDNFILMHEEAGGDLFYPAAPFYYIPWMEAIIGCPIYIGKESFYAKPFIHEWENFSWNIDLRNNKWVHKFVEIKSILLEYLNINYPMSTSSLLRGPADMMAASLGQTRFPLELYDNPDKIKKLSQLYSNIFIEVAKIANKIALNSKFNGYLVDYYGLWSPKICQYFQDDAVALISPKFYEMFIFNEHLKISKSFGSTFYHLHPISLFIIDKLLALPNLDIIEVNREPIGPSIEELIPSLRLIQQHNKSLLINFTNIDFSSELIEEEVKIIYRNLSMRGLGIFLSVENVNDGINKINAINNAIKSG
ncbi:MAG: hypothetical protein M1479_09465 [Actinobacteria bacterium]|nr:hypothetical protein [Cyanobacteriota bacterium]MCL5772481.1 hypothetical protein [Actinomycetota bacterium]